MKKFRVDFQTSVEIELDEALIERALGDEWRDTFYNLGAAEEVAAHIAYNFVVNSLSMAQLDGFADLDGDRARIVVGPHWDVNATAIPEKTRKP
jgi:hypothetical protein